MKKSYRLHVVGSLFLLILTLLMYTSYTKVEKKSLVIGFAGDTMLGRSVNETLMTMPRPQSYYYPWGNVLSLLQSNDLNIVNLETTLTTSIQKVPKVFNFKATPALVAALQVAHIDVVNIANNHILDFSVQGLEETLHVLDDAKIYHVGAGITRDQAQKPVIMYKNGIRIGIVGFTDNEPGWKAGRDTPGTNYVKVGDIETIKKVTYKIRNDVDILIVSIHWGPNKIEQPTQEFIDFAHQIIDAGVDIIHGHSAHLVQGIEIYKQKLILYNCGDFVDDYAVYKDARNDLGFLFLVTLDKDGPRYVQGIPTVIAHYQVNQATGADREYSMNRMRLLCSYLGTSMNEQGIITIRT